MFRRVISDSEDVGQSHKKAKTDMDPGEPSAPLQDMAPTPMPAVVTASHVVEDDAAGSSAPLEIIQSSGRAPNSASNSSLSDGSDSGCLEGAEDPLVPGITNPKKKNDKEEIVPQTLQRVVQRSTLNRMDSAADGSSSGSQRASSQNSRDWGWFEDVHQASDGLNAAEKKKVINPSQPANIAPPAATHGTLKRFFDYYFG